MLAADERPGAGLVIPLLSAANFIIGIGAFLVIGILSPMVADLGVSAARGGWIMTSYALGYAVLSPILVSLTGGVGRRRVIAGGLVAFALASALSALAPNDIVLNLARVLAAAGAGVVTPVAAAVAAGLSGPGRQGRALASVFFGLTMAQVVGVPVGSFLAYMLGWRAAFWVVSGLALPVALAVWVMIPAGLSFRPVTLRDLRQVLTDMRQMAVILFTASFLGAIYVVYTFFSPILTETMGFGRNEMTLALVIYGVGAVAGNLMSGRMSDAIGPFRTLLIVSGSQVILMPVFSILPLPVWQVYLFLFLWPAFGWSFMAAQQARLMRMGPERAPVLMALNAASIYVGAALGSALGGLVLAGWGMAALGLGGAAAAAWAMLHLVVTRGREDGARSE
ncbi:MFS transporter [Aquicoccus porphyridii]|uniref:MFS transporter n=1 Tax=Aquicoccus porphyridii TaxID=1852029 RepID=A0A5A9YZM2_9RHOB|nr:MFS transporter [Aquicoccus porphyridii]KAA0910298.1 MFS transporter [Aquicoccus porphyridii]RAI54439.1 MFS transporter [Rhodobacteraceae bacterium AsT-22]